MPPDPADRLAARLHRALGDDWHNADPATYHSYHDLPEPLRERLRAGAKELEQTVLFGDDDD